MFYSCSQLIFLNLKNFIENNSLDITNIFNVIPDNIVICLNENSNKILTQISQKKCFSINCSYEMKANNYSNCYKNCNYYHFFNSDNTFCTLDFSCPDNYPHLIQDKNECIVYENITNEIINEDEFIEENKEVNIDDTNIDNDIIKEEKKVESSIIIFNNNNNSNYTKIIEAYSEIMLIIEKLIKK